MKRLHFAGYDFTSGPDGTKVHRQLVGSLTVGTRVKYNDVNLPAEGVIETLEGKFCTVRWDRYPGFASREWLANLQRV